MPALSNPKHEAFAQAFVASLTKPNGKGNSATQAYLDAGYRTSRNGAGASAARLLGFVSSVAARVQELQSQQLARIQPKLDVSKERVGRRLDIASQIAEQDRNASAMATSELGIAKLFGHLKDTVEINQPSFATARSINEIAQLLLHQVGFQEPYPPSALAAAVTAHDRFINDLRAIALEHDVVMLED